MLNIINIIMISEPSRNVCALNYIVNCHFAWGEGGRVPGKALGGFS